MADLGNILKEARRRSGLTQAEIAARLGKSRRAYQYYEEGKVIPDHTLLRSIAQFLPFTETEIAHIEKTFALKTPLGHPDGEDLNTETEPYLTTRQKKKVNFDQETDGIAFVPIAAQAGYTRSYVDAVFLNQLDRIYMPGFPYRGSRYRAFEVDGSSMEPTFKEGYYLICEKIEQENWFTIPDYYAYVVITHEQVLLKRIFKKSNTDFILISDNEEFYPQFAIRVGEIKEIWQVKRKMDWELSPPKKFEIKV